MADEPQLTETAAVAEPVATPQDRGGEVITATPPAPAPAPAQAPAEERQAQTQAAAAQAKPGGAVAPTKTKRSRSSPASTTPKQRGSFIMNTFPPGILEPTSHRKPLYIPWHYLANYKASPELEELARTAEPYYKMVASIDQKELVHRFVSQHLVAQPEVAATYGPNFAMGGVSGAMGPNLTNLAPNIAPFDLLDTVPACESSVTTQLLRAIQYYHNTLAPTLAQGKENLSDLAETKVAFGIALVDYIPQGCHIHNPSFFLLYCIAGAAGKGRKHMKLPQSAPGSPFPPPLTGTECNIWFVFGIIEVLKELDLIRSKEPAALLELHRSETIVEGYLLYLQRYKALSKRAKQRQQANKATTMAQMSSAVSTTASTPAEEPEPQGAVGADPLVRLEELSPEKRVAPEKDLEPLLPMLPLSTSQEVVIEQQPQPVEQAQPQPQAQQTPTPPPPPAV